MKTALIIIGSIILAAAIGAGGFYAGTRYEANQANQVRNQFFAARGLNGAGGTAADGQGRSFTGQGGQAGGFFGGGTTGQVQSVNGNILTVSTLRNTATVNLSDATKIEKPGPATISDLQPGVEVLVTGQRDANGNIAAEQITILNFTPTNAGRPTPTGTAP